MPVTEDELNELARSIGNRIGSSLPKGVGFSLIVFTFGEGGWLSYISNGQREDVLKMLDEYRERLKAGIPAKGSGK